MSEPRRRRPLTIGFEQLETREVCSAGLALTIIPAEVRPLILMPRPDVATFDPQAVRPFTVSLNPRLDPEPELGPWPGTLGERFGRWTR